MAHGNDNPPPVIKGTLADHRPARRLCLKCDKRFDSLGPGNRICGRCRLKQADLSKRQEGATGVDYGDRS